jgi:hypothetical protein
MLNLPQKKQGLVINLGKLKSKSRGLRYTTQLYLVSFDIKKKIYGILLYILVYSSYVSHLFIGFAK